MIKMCHHEKKGSDCASFFFSYSLLSLRLRNPCPTAATKWRLSPALICVCVCDGYVVPRYVVGYPLLFVYLWYRICCLWYLYSWYCFCIRDMFLHPWFLSVFMICVFIHGVCLDPWYLSCLIFVFIHCSCIHNLCLYPWCLSSSLIFVFVIIQELEREERIEKEKREGGPDPRILEMEALGAQVTPRGTTWHNTCFLTIHNSRWFRRVSFMWAYVVPILPNGTAKQLFLFSILFTVTLANVGLGYGTGGANTN